MSVRCRPNLLLNRKQAALKPFVFLDLPGEIRNLIYEHMFVLRDATIKIEPYRSKRHPHRLFDATIHPSLSVTLFRTCRQVYEEAASVLYGKHIFHAEVTNARHPLFDLSKAMLGQTPVRHVKKLDIKIAVYRDGLASLESWTQRRQNRRRYCELFGQMTSLTQLTICVRRSGCSYWNEPFNEQRPDLNDCIRYLVASIPRSVNIEWTAPHRRCPSTNCCADKKVLEMVAKKHENVRGTNPSIKRLKQVGK